jgi:hypothetical protein
MLELDLDSRTNSIPTLSAPRLAGDQGLDVDDALALLPEIRAQSSGLVVLGRSSFSLNSSMQVADPHALLPGLEELLDGHLLGPGDDVLDHRAGVEVLEVQHFLVTVDAGDLEEPVSFKVAPASSSGAESVSTCTAVGRA